MLIGAKPKAAPTEIKTAEETEPKVSFWLYLFCGFGLILFSNAINVILLFGKVEEGSGIGLLQIIRLLNYTGFIGLAFLMLVQRKLILPAMGVFLTSILILAVLSIFWSIAPKDTLIRTYGLIGSTMLGVVMAMLFSWKNFLKLSLYSYLVIILITFVVCLAWPQVGLHHGDSHSGAWGGAFGQKNVMGRVMILGFVLLFFARRILSGKEKILAAFGMAGSAVLVVLSTSTTAMVSLIMLTIMVMYAPFFLKRKVLLVSLASFSAMAALLFFTLWDLSDLMGAFFAITGKDATLTGRTDIWSTAIRLWFDKNFLLGFGYGGFWETAAGNQSVFWGMEDYVPPHAHNGLIQIGTELGLVGLALTVLYLLGSAKRVWNFAGAASADVALIPLILFCMFVILNVSEVNMFTQRNAIWILFVYSVTRVRIDLKEMKKLSEKHTLPTYKFTK